MLTELSHYAGSPESRIFVPGQVTLVIRHKSVVASMSYSVLKVKTPLVRYVVNWLYSKCRVLVVQLSF